MNTEDKARKIEREIDNLFRSHKFMQVPQSVAVQYLLIIYEEANRLPILMGEHVRSVDRFRDLALTENNKYGLTHAINWATKTCRMTQEKTIMDINEDIYLTASDFFEMAMSYHEAVSGYTMWSRGLAEIVNVNTNTVHFKYAKEEMRYDMLDRKLYVERLQRHLAESVEIYQQRLIKAKMAIEKTVKQTGEHTITYSSREIDRDNIMSVAYDSMRGHVRPPENWQFYHIMFEDLIKFWGALLSLCMLHFFALFYAATNLAIKGGAIASTIIVRAKSDWVRQLSRWTGLTKQTVSKILEWHTYSANHKKPDIVLTPFIHVTEKQLALSPTLIVTNNLGRNLLKHLSKNYKNEYDRNSWVFENNMISKFANSMTRSYFKIKTKIKIPGVRKLPDIDVCLLDESRRQIMLCEFKWTTPAAEPAEILEKRELERKAVSQLSYLREYINSQPEKVAEILDIDKHIIFEKIFYVGVLENCAGTAFMFNEDFPIIEYGIFCNLLKEKESLEDVFNYTKERNYLPREDVDFKVVDEENKIGKFKIIWTGFIPSQR